MRAEPGDPLVVACPAQIPSWHPRAEGRGGLVLEVVHNLSAPGAKRRAAPPLPALIVGFSWPQESKGRVLQFFVTSSAQKRLPVTGSGRVPSATPRFPAQSSHWAPLRGCLPRGRESSTPSSVTGLGWRILKPRLSGAPWFFPAQSPPRAAHAWGSLTRSAALQMGPAARGSGLQGVVTEPARPAAGRAVYGYCASGKGHEAGQARGGSTLAWLPEQGLL